MNTKIVGIAGGSGSGKSTLARLIADAVGPACQIISSDHYYHCQGHLTPDERAAVNFDHPDALDLSLLGHHLESLKRTQTVASPRYCFTTHTRQADTLALRPSPLVLVEGVLIFTSPQIRQALDLLVFVEAVDEIRLRRRLERDVQQRGRSAESVTKQWRESVVPMHEQHVAPTRQYAHIIVNSSDPHPLLVEVMVAGIGALGRAE